MKKKIVLLFVLLMLRSNIYAQTTYIKYADSLYLIGNYSKAIEIYKKTNQKDTNKKIAEAYLAIGNHQLALEYYKKSLISNPNNILVKYKYGKLLSMLKKDKEALKVFNELIEIDDSNPNYYYELGIVLEHQKNKEAIDKFKEVFRIDNKHQKAIYKIAKHYLIKRNYDSVNHYVDKGLKSYSNNIALISLKAQNYYKNKEYSEAIKWFQKLIDLKESNQYIHEKLASSYAHIHQAELAIEHGLKTLEFDPENETNLYLLGQFYEKIEDYKNAEKYINKAISVINIRLDKKYVRLGYVQFQQQKYKDAIQTFKNALKENSKNEEAQFYLIYTKDKYYKDANIKIKLYEDFKKQFPMSKFINTVNTRLKLLKKEKFLNVGK